VKRFIANHADDVTGVLSGFDRLVLRGTIRPLAFVDGLKRLLWKRQVLLKNFGDYAQSLTAQLKEASLGQAKAASRPVEYLPSSRTSKEDVARKIAKRDGVESGLIAVLSSLEPCMSYDIFRNRDAKRLELVSRPRKGLALYHYFVDPVFGFMHARIQTWLPFGIQICLNGREWLARTMDRAGLGYRRRENCFVAIDNVERAQRMIDRQLALAWPAALDRIARAINPAHGLMFDDFAADYYWSVHQSEWATDVMFRNSSALAAIYPSLVRHGMTTFSSPDVMRFLGGKVHGAFKGEIISDFKNRPEGVRIKHRVGQNSVKLYDKQGSVLRVETTINNPCGMKVFRPREGDSDGPSSWRPMRKGIADLHRRTRLSQASNDRYLDALASVDTATPLGELVRKICAPTQWRGKRVRALRPWAQEDTALFQAVNRGEFAVNGFRNRDLQAHLCDRPAQSPQEKKRRSAQVTRLLRMLRAHGLIRKVQSSHRYVLTAGGRDLIAAVLTTQRVTLEQLQTVNA
jgi:hypothetical protein